MATIPHDSPKSASKKSSCRHYCESEIRAASAALSRALKVPQPSRISVLQVLDQVEAAVYLAECCENYCIRQSETEWKHSQQLKQQGKIHEQIDQQLKKAEDEERDKKETKKQQAESLEPKKSSKGTNAKKMLNIVELKQEKKAEKQAAHSKELSSASTKAPVALGAASSHASSSPQAAVEEVRSPIRTIASSLVYCILRLGAFEGVIRIRSWKLLSKLGSLSSFESMQHMVNDMQSYIYRSKLKKPPGNDSKPKSEKKRNPTRSDDADIEPKLASSEQSSSNLEPPSDHLVVMAGQIMCHMMANRAWIPKSQNIRISDEQILMQKVVRFILAPDTFPRSHTAMMIAILLEPFSLCQVCHPSRSCILMDETSMALIVDFLRSHSITSRHATYPGAAALALILSRLLYSESWIHQGSMCGVTEKRDEAYCKRAEKFSNCGESLAMLSVKMASALSSATLKSCNQARVQAALWTESAVLSVLSLDKKHADKLAKSLSFAAKPAGQTSFFESAFERLLVTCLWFSFESSTSETQLLQPIPLALPHLLQMASSRDIHMLVNNLCASFVAPVYSLKDLIVLVIQPLMQYASRDQKSAILRVGRDSLLAAHKLQTTTEAERKKPVSKHQTAFLFVLLSDAMRDVGCSGHTTEDIQALIGEALLFLSDTIDAYRSAACALLSTCFLQYADIRSELIARILEGLIECFETVYRHHEPLQSHGNHSPKGMSKGNNDKEDANAPNVGNEFSQTKSKRTRESELQNAVYGVLGYSLALSCLLSCQESISDSEGQAGLYPNSMASSGSRFPIGALSFNKMQLVELQSACIALLTWPSVSSRDLKVCVAALVSRRCAWMLIGRLSHFHHIQIPDEVVMNSLLPAMLRDLSDIEIPKAADVCLPSKPNAEQSEPEDGTVCVETAPGRELSNSSSLADRSKEISDMCSMPSAASAADGHISYLGSLLRIAALEALRHFMQVGISEQFRRIADRLLVSGGAKLLETAAELMSHSFSCSAPHCIYDLSNSNGSSSITIQSSASNPGASIPSTLSKSLPLSDSSSPPSSNRDKEKTDLVSSSKCGFRVHAQRETLMMMLSEIRSILRIVPLSYLSKTGMDICYSLGILAGQYCARCLVDRDESNYDVPGLSRYMVHKFQNYRKYSPRVPLVGRAVDHEMTNLAELDEVIYECLELGSLGKHAARKDQAASALSRRRSSLARGKDDQQGSHADNEFQNLFMIARAPRVGSIESISICAEAVASILVSDLDTCGLTLENLGLAVVSIQRSGSVTESKQLLRSKGISPVFGAAIACGISRYLSVNDLRKASRAVASTQVLAKNAFSYFASYQKLCYEIDNSYHSAETGALGTLEACLGISPDQYDLSVSGFEKDWERNNMPLWSILSSESTGHSYHRFRSSAESLASEADLFRGRLMYAVLCAVECFSNLARKGGVSMAGRLSENFATTLRGCQSETLPAVPQTYFSVLCALIESETLSPELLSSGMRTYQMYLDCKLSLSKRISAASMPGNLCVGDLEQGAESLLVSLLNALCDERGKPLAKALLHVDKNVTGDRWNSDIVLYRSRTVSSPGQTAATSIHQSQALDSKPWISVWGNDLSARDICWAVLRILRSWDPKKRLAESCLSVARDIVKIVLLDIDCSDMVTRSMALNILYEILLNQTRFQLGLGAQKTTILSGLMVSPLSPAFVVKEIRKALKMQGDTEDVYVFMEAACNMLLFLARTSDVPWLFQVYPEMLPDLFSSLENGFLMVDEVIKFVSVFISETNTVVFLQHFFAEAETIAGVSLSAGFRRVEPNEDPGKEVSRRKSIVKRDESHMADSRSQLLYFQVLHDAVRGLMEASKLLDSATKARLNSEALFLCYQFVCDQKDPGFRPDTTMEAEVDGIQAKNKCHTKPPRLHLSAGRTSAGIWDGPVLSEVFQIMATIYMNSEADVVTSESEPTESPCLSISYGIDAVLWYTENAMNFSKDTYEIGSALNLASCLFVGGAAGNPDCLPLDITKRIVTSICSADGYCFDLFLRNDRQEPLAYELGLDALAVCASALSHCQLCDFDNTMDAFPATFVRNVHAQYACLGAVLSKSLVTDELDDLVPPDHKADKFDGVFLDLLADWQYMLDGRASDLVIGLTVTSVLVARMDEMKTRNAREEDQADDEIYETSALDRPSASTADFSRLLRSLRAAFKPEQSRYEPVFGVLSTMWENLLQADAPELYWSTSFFSSHQAFYVLAVWLATGLKQQESSNTNGDTDDDTPSVTEITWELCSRMFERDGLEAARVCHAVLQRYPTSLDFNLSVLKASAMGITESEKYDFEEQDNIDQSARNREGSRTLSKSGRGSRKARYGTLFDSEESSGAHTKSDGKGGRSSELAQRTEFSSTAYLKLAALALQKVAAYSPVPCVELINVLGSAALDAVFPNAEHFPSLSCRDEFTNAFTQVVSILATNMRRSPREDRQAMSKQFLGRLCTLISQYEGDTPQEVEAATDEGGLRSRSSSLRGSIDSLSVLSTSPCVFYGLLAGCLWLAYDSQLDPGGAKPQEGSQVSSFIPAHSDALVPVMECFEKHLVATLEHYMEWKRVEGSSLKPPKSALLPDVVSVDSSLQDAYVCDLLKSCWVTRYVLGISESKVCIVPLLRTILDTEDTQISQQSLQNYHKCVEVIAPWYREWSLEQQRSLSMDLFMLELVLWSVRRMEESQRLVNGPVKNRKHPRGKPALRRIDSIPNAPKGLLTVVQNMNTTDKERLVEWMVLHSQFMEHRIKNMGHVWNQLITGDLETSVDENYYASLAEVDP